MESKEKEQIGCAERLYEHVLNAANYLQDGRCQTRIRTDSRKDIRDRRRRTGRFRVVGFSPTLKRGLELSF